MADAKVLFVFVAVAAMIGYFVAISSFLVRLDLYHHELWTEFGSPKVMPVNPK